MGYTTEFEGRFTLDRPLTPEQIAYLKAFNESRRMQRNAEQTATLPDPIRDAVGLPVGDAGAYYVGAAGDNFGQDMSPDILNYNQPPTGQPGLWCQWVPTRDGLYIEWDGGEKFYQYAQWLAYLVEHFLKPWDYTLNGQVTWDGEDSTDFGMLVVQDNRVGARLGERTYGETRWEDA